MYSRFVPPVKSFYFVPYARAPEDELARVKAEVPGLMSGVAKLKVPLVVDVGSGQNWEKAH